VRVIIFVIAIGILVTGCGLSEKEKNRVASRACGEILDTRKFESSKRAQIWNDAVDKIGINGTYWSYYSDTTVELIIMTKGSWGANRACVDALLKGSAPF
jgi:hypothetical protein